MKTLHVLLTRTLYIFILAAGTLCSPGSTKFWVGNSLTTANWNDPANWTPAGAPTHGDTLFFPANVARPVNTNNLISITFNTIHFAGSNYIVWGNGLNVTNTIRSLPAGGTNKIYADVFLGTADVSIDVTNNSRLHLHGGVTGSVGVNKLGAGVLGYYSAGLNGYSGATVVRDGELRLGCTGGVGFSGTVLTITNSGTVVLEHANEMPDTTTVKVSGDCVLDLNGYSDVIGFLELYENAAVQTGSGTLTLGGLYPTILIQSGGGDASISGKLNFNNTCTVNGAYGYAWIYASLGGSGGLVNQGSSGFVLTSSNWFAQNLTVNHGSVWLWNSKACGGAPNVYVNNDAMLYLHGNMGITNKHLWLNTSHSPALYSYDTTGYTNYWAGPVTLSSSAQIDVDLNCALRVVGAIDGVGGFTKSGGGRLRLLGDTANTYSGPTVVTNGMLELGKSVVDGAIKYGSLSVTNAVVRELANDQIAAIPVNLESCILDLNGYNDSIGTSLNMSLQGNVVTGSGILTLADGAVVTASMLGLIDGHLNLAGKCEFDLYGQLNVAASIGGPDDVQLVGMNGDAELILSGSNFFTGALTATNLTVEVCNSWGCGATNGVITILGSGCIDLELGVNVSNKALVLSNSPGAGLWGSRYNYVYTNSWTGPITLLSDTGIGVRSGAELDIMGPISGPGSLTKDSDGTAVLGGSTANTYAGITRVNGGVLTLSKTGNKAAIPGAMIISGGIVNLAANEQTARSSDLTIESTGRFEKGNYINYVNALQGSGQLDLGTSGYLVVGYANGGSTFSGSISSGGGPLYKYGKGTLILEGPQPNFNTYTRVLNGAVLFNDIQTNSTVDNLGGSSGTTGGTNTIGHVTVTGKLKPGMPSSASILTCSNLTFSSAGTYFVDINGTTAGSGYDQMKARGAVTLANATLKPTLSCMAPSLTSYTIIDNDGSDAVVGTFSGLPEGTTFSVNGTPFRITYAGGTGNDVVIAQQTATQRPLITSTVLNKTNLMLTWSADFSGYQLETCVDLSSTAWWAVPTNQILYGTNWTLTNILAEPQRFYRLSPPSDVPSGMAMIPAGTFTMGNCMDSTEGYLDELPLHDVYLSVFYMDRNDVCKALWDDVYRWATNHGYSFNDGLGKAANHPVQMVSWYDCVKWCNARSEMEGLAPAYYTSSAQTTVYRTGSVAVDNDSVKWDAGYRLPTEAEWEKAARSGASGHRFPWSDSDTVQHARANYYSSDHWAYDTSPTRGYHPTFATGGETYTSPVGYFAPNGYALYDMAGNVWQWCWDWYDSAWYSNAGATQSDTRGPKTSPSGYPYRVLRGGNWLGIANYARCAARDTYGPDNAVSFIGFRCVRGF